MLHVEVYCQILELAIYFYQKSDNINRRNSNLASKIKIVIHI